MYEKHLYLYDKHQQPRPAVVRPYSSADFDELIAIQRESFPPPFPEELCWNRTQLQTHVTLFPAGALCVEVEGQLAGSITGMRMQYQPGDPDHTWADVTDDGYIRTHNPHGNTLYIVDISVRPAFRSLGIGKVLMQAMYELVIALRLDRLLGGGRLSGYHRYAAELTAEQYAARVLAGALHDPVMTFLLRCGRTPVKVLPGYLPDEESRDYAMLMEWKNPFVAHRGGPTMRFARITDIHDPLFRQMHELMQTVFPKEEVLDFPLWAEPLKDDGLRICVAVVDDEVVGATEYRYFLDLEIAMTDFTIIGRDGLGIGPFLAQHRQADLQQWAAREGRPLKGMFAEIYDPYSSQEEHPFGGVKSMNPYVRREVLSHLGYRKLDIDYVHPSWLNDGEAVRGLNFSYLSYEAGMEALPAELIVTFLTRYYAVLDNKPAAWLSMIEDLRTRQTVRLLPL